MCPRIYRNYFHLINKSSILYVLFDFFPTNLDISEGLIPYPGLLNPKFFKENLSPILIFLIQQYFFELLLNYQFHIFEFLIISYINLYF